MSDMQLATLWKLGFDAKAVQVFPTVRFHKIIQAIVILRAVSHPTAVKSIEDDLHLQLAFMRSCHDLFYPHYVSYCVYCLMLTNNRIHFS
jgi:hypothetical protein